jgi:hypothetical protein
MRTILICAFVTAACAHQKESQVVAAAEPPETLYHTFTADTARLTSDPNDTATFPALVSLVERQLAVVGKPRPNEQRGEQTIVAVDLPAPGWALRARLSPKPEQLCQVTLEPIALAPSEHTVTAAPWSVQRALEDVRRDAMLLKEPRDPPMAPARWQRLRVEAQEAAAAGRDPLLTPNEFVRVPRPITREGTDAPYYTPPEGIGGSGP